MKEKLSLRCTQQQDARQSVCEAHRRLGGAVQPVTALRAERKLSTEPASQAPPGPPKTGAGPAGVTGCTSRTTSPDLLREGGVGAGLRGNPGSLHLEACCPRSFLWCWFGRESHRRALRGGPPGPDPKSTWQCSCPLNVQPVCVHALGPRDSPIRVCLGLIVRLCTVRGGQRAGLHCTQVRPVLWEPGVGQLVGRGCRVEAGSVPWGRGSGSGRLSEGGVGREPRKRAEGGPEPLGAPGSRVTVISLELPQGALGDR